MPELIWRKSPWDHNVHAFREFSELVSQAVCDHSALTNRLAEPSEGDRKCLGCLLLHGNELADRLGDRDRYVT